MTIKKGK